MSRVDVRESNGRETTLVTRLDPAIGETSTGIGLLMSELVRRSLRAGVAEIDETIHSFATEQVDVAVERKMAEVTEVAETTSRRVSETAVRKVAEKTEQATELLTKSLNSAVDRLESELGETRRRTDETGLTLQEVREKARLSWKKISAELERLKATDSTLHQELAEAQEKSGHSWKEISAEIERLQGTDSILHRELAQAREREIALQNGLARVEAELSQNQQRLQAVLSQLESVSGRLAEVERPKGWSALLQRIRGKSKSTPSVLPPSTESIPEDDGASADE